MNAETVSEITSLYPKRTHATHFAANLRHAEMILEQTAVQIINFENELAKKRVELEELAGIEEPSVTTESKIGAKENMVAWLTARIEEEQEKAVGQEALRDELQAALTAELGEIKAGKAEKTRKLKEIKQRKGAAAAASTFEKVESLKEEKAKDDGKEKDSAQD